MPYHHTRAVPPVAFRGVGFRRGDCRSFFGGGNFPESRGIHLHGRLRRGENETQSGAGSESEGGVSLGREEDSRSY